MPADVTIGGTPAGRVQIELFADVVPKTAENVRQFFTGDYRYLQLSATSGSSTADSGQYPAGAICNQWDITGAAFTESSKDS